MKPELSCLLLGPESRVRAEVCTALEEAGFKAVPVDEPADVGEAVESCQPALLLAMGLAETDLQDVSAQLKRSSDTARILLIRLTGFPGGTEQPSARSYLLFDGYLNWQDGLASIVARMKAFFRQYEVDTELGAGETLFRTIFNQAGSGIGLVDLETGYIQECNPALAAMLGYTVEELAGRTVASISHQDDQVLDEKYGRELIEGKRQRFQMEKRYLRKDGRLLWGLLTAAVVQTPRGVTPFVIGMVEDITERKEAQAQWQRAQRMESIATMAGGMAHYLNNLLMPIIMGTDLLKTMHSDKASHTVIDGIRASANRGAELVKKVLSSARGVKVERVAVSIPALFDEVASIIRNTFPNRISFESHIDGDVRPVSGDPSQLSQVLLNLCVNARDAMPEGGKLELLAQKEVLQEPSGKLDPGVYMVISVRDTGVGMTADVIERILDPFYTTKEVGKGTGLGLPTSVGTVRSHGGALDVQSEEGQGSVFEVYLPAAAEDEGVGEDDAGPAEAGGSGADRLREKILIVDDEEMILNVTRHALESVGYSVLVADNGTEAMRRFRAEKSRISLVISDVMMSGMSGPELVSELRKLEPDIPIIAVSGVSGFKGRQCAESMQAARFLPKPFSVDALLKTVQQALT